MEASQTPAAPTPEQAQASAQQILERAEAAAKRAESAAQAGPAAHQAAQAEAERQYPDMPDELVAKIADTSAKAVLAALGAEYELREQPGAPPTEPGSTLPDGTAAGTTTNADGGQNVETPPAERPPPAKKTLAQRILGE